MSLSQKFTIFIITLMSITVGQSQNVGVATNTPDAPFHVSSSGQVLTPGGLMLLGNRSEAHLEMDFNKMQSLFGQPANPISLLLQPAGGNVGIGTLNPLSRMDIVGTSNQFLSLHKTSIGVGEVGINFLRGSINNETDWRIANESGKLKFRDATNNFTGASDVNMTIDQNGRVGIGIESPQSALHVIGTELVGETGEGYFQVGDPLSYHLRFDGNEILARNNDSPSTLFFQYWSGNLALCNNTAGRVGIGTTAPAAKVHIVDGTDVTLAGGGEIVLGQTATLNLAMDGNEIQARNNGNASPLFIQGEGGDVLLIPNENGQVGIGILSSASMPSSDYLLAVDGKIIVEEVRVEMSGDWPDYVFMPEYELMSLTDLEKSIKEQGHLPGIPSALDVKEQGFELGNMQKLMMEKIEELTLYLIDANKKIERLESFLKD